VDGNLLRGRKKEGGEGIKTWEGTGVFGTGPEKVKKGAKKITRIAAKTKKVELGDIEKARMGGMGKRKKSTIGKGTKKERCHEEHRI